MYMYAPLQHLTINETCDKQPHWHIGSLVVFRKRKFTLKHLCHSYLYLNYSQLDDSCAQWMLGALQLFSSVNTLLWVTADRPTGCKYFTDVTQHELSCWPLLCCQSFYFLLITPSEILQENEIHLQSYYFKDQSFQRCMRSKPMIVHEANQFLIRDSFSCYWF